MTFIRRRLAMALAVASLGTGLALTAPAAAAPAPAPAPAPAGNVSVLGVCNYNGAHPLLRQGSRGAAVAHLQCLLVNVHRISVGPAGIDGRFGSDTTLAVKRFQTRKGLKADGLVGRDTWNRLHP